MNKIAERDVRLKTLKRYIIDLDNENIEKLDESILNLSKASNSVDEKAILKIIKAVYPKFDKKNCSFIKCLYLDDSKDTGKYAVRLAALEVYCNLSSNSNKDEIDKKLVELFQSNSVVHNKDIRAVIVAESGSLSQNNTDYIRILYEKNSAAQIDFSTGVQLVSAYVLTVTCIESVIALSEVAKAVLGILGMLLLACLCGVTLKDKLKHIINSIAELVSVYSILFFCLDSMGIQIRFPEKLLGLDIGGTTIKLTTFVIMEVIVVSLFIVIKNKLRGTRRK